jgi:hypothetical protein
MSGEVHRLVTWDMTTIVIPLRPSLRGPSVCEKPIPCYLCHKTDHHAVDYQNAQVCRLYGARGHFTHECTRSYRHYNKVDNHLTDDCLFVKYANCDMFGHTARECPEEKRGNRVCRRYGQIGYVVSDCPAKSRMICHICELEATIY